MPQKHLMIAIDWFGPYSLDDARRAAANDGYGPGLYMCTGRREGEEVSAIQYVGIGKALQARLIPGHHKLQLVVAERRLWLGQISTAEPSGKKIKVTQAGLDYAEWLHARFLRLPLNDKKTKSLPPRSVTVLNRWFRADDWTGRRNRPHPDWPDLIDFPAYEMPARAVWFGGRQRRFLASDGYADPA
jgi:hypothetical protein